MVHKLLLLCNATPTGAELLNMHHTGFTPAAAAAATDIMPGRVRSSTDSFVTSAMFSDTAPEEGVGAFSTRKKASMAWDIMDADKDGFMNRLITRLIGQKLRTVQELQRLNFRVIAVGTSFNDRLLPSLPSLFKSASITVCLRQSMR